MGGSKPSLFLKFSVVPEELLMLLQDTPINKLSDNLDSKLFFALEDIVNNLQIQDNFCISHPSYKLLELPSEVVERLNAMPPDLQQKYVNSQLRSFLYGIHYNGSLKASLSPESDTVVNSQNLENNTFLGMDLDFYDQINNSNTGRGYFDEDWLVLREEEDGAIAVSKGGLTVHIRRDLHLESTDDQISVGDLISIRLPKNLLQSGFYMAVSDAGTHSPQSFHSQLVRIYWSLSPEGAIAVMKSLTQKLNAINLPFTFKVLYNPSDYQRHDSGVLYFDNHHYEAVYPILQSLYAEHQGHFLAEIPLFTKLLAPGLALAEEPNQRFSPAESFGLNRCQIIANGLLLAHEREDKSPEGRMSLILDQFSLLGIDIQKPYLNAESIDIYPSLNHQG
jgi:HopA1 effector protein family